MHNFVSKENGMNIANWKQNQNEKITWKQDGKFNCCCWSQPKFGVLLICSTLIKTFERTHELKSLSWANQRCANRSKYKCSASLYLLKSHRHFFMNRWQFEEMIFYRCVQMNFMLYFIVNNATPMFNHIQINNYVGIREINTEFCFQ